MAETKTQPTDASVDAYLASRASPEQLGRHTMGKSCLYFKRLADLDVKVLEKLIAGSVAEINRRHPRAGEA